jgi:hypothetical protein
MYKNVLKALRATVFYTSVFHSQIGHILIPTNHIGYYSHNSILFELLQNLPDTECASYQSLVSWNPSGLSAQELATRPDSRASAVHLTSSQPINLTSIVTLSSRPCFCLVDSIHDALHQNFICTSCFHLCLLNLGPTKLLKFRYLHKTAGRITILHILISRLLERNREASELNDSQNLLKISSWSPWMPFMFVIYLNLGYFEKCNIFTVLLGAPFRAVTIFP